MDLNHKQNGEKIDRNLGRNHVNQTTRHGIVAHHLWEENLGNITEVIVTDSFSFGPKSLVLLPKLYLKRENSNPKLFLSEIAFGQRNWRLRATNPKESLTKTSVTFPKFSSQRQWAMIPCLAVSFTWLHPRYHSVSWLCSALCIFPETAHALDWLTAYCLGSEIMYFESKCPSETIISCFMSALNSIYQMLATADLVI